MYVSLYRQRGATGHSHILLIFVSQPVRVVFALGYRLAFYRLFTIESIELRLTIFRLTKVKGPESPFFVVVSQIGTLQVNRHH